MGVELAAEVGKLVSESVRSEAERVAASVRGSLLSVANVTPASAGGRLYRVPRQAAQNERAAPDGRPPASPKGTCCVCWVSVAGGARYCETHRREKFSEQRRKLWSEGKVKGARSEDANHGSNPVDWKAKREHAKGSRAERERGITARKKAGIFIMAACLHAARKQGDSHLGGVSGVEIAPSELNRYVGKNTKVV